MDENDSVNAKDKIEKMPRRSSRRTFGIFAVSKHDVLDAGPLGPFVLPTDVVVYIVVHDLNIHDLAMLLHPIFTGHGQSGITHGDDVRNQRW